MTDLLRPAASRTSSRPAAEVATRPLAVGAALAGLFASLSVLVGCMAVGLVGWFASDGGSHGDTRDALRVGADAWLLGLGAHLHLGAGAAGATVTAVPLGLTALSAFLCYRLGGWAADTSEPEERSGVALAAVVLAGIYGVVALVTAVLATARTAEPGLLRSFGGGFLLALLAGGAGLLSRTDPGWWRERVPETVRAGVAGAVATTLLLVTAASALLATMLLLDLGAAATVLSRLHADAWGSLLFTVLVAAVAPNAVLLTGSYLLGPGFAVGTGTVVSPTVVVLGPVPAFPLLAALPDDGAQPAWLVAVVAVPVLLAAVGAVLVLRRFPVTEYGAGLVRGLAAGVGAGVLTTLLVWLAGGAVGPGRMADVGAPFLETLLAATAAMGAGGGLGALLATWRARRG